MIEGEVWVTEHAKEQILKKEKENATAEKENASEAKANQERKATNLKNHVSKYKTVRYIIINVQRLNALDVFC